MALNGSALTQQADNAAFDAAGSGWYNDGGNLVVAKSASLAKISDRFSTAVHRLAVDL